MALPISWHLNCSAQKSTSEKKPTSGLTESWHSSWQKAVIHSRVLSTRNWPDWPIRASSYSSESTSPYLSNSSTKSSKLTATNARQLSKFPNSSGSNNNDFNFCAFGSFPCYQNNAQIGSLIQEQMPENVTIYCGPEEHRRNNLNNDKMINL